MSTLLESDKIYLSVPHMSGHERHFVDQAFDMNWLSTVGPNVDLFEQEMAEHLASDMSALAVSSGTAALHLILRWLQVGPGDDVAVSTLTFAGSVFPILYLGARPVLLDSEAVSGNIDADLVEEYFASASRRGRLPKALVAVHLYGQHCDIDALAAACSRFGVPLVEDSAESLGATYRGRRTGTSGDFALLSFNGNKIITTTGGGMVLTRNRSALAQMRKWANQSREPAIEYVHREMGYNYRMSNVLAGIGRGQLRVLEQRVDQRRAVAERYRTLLANVPGLELQKEAEWGRHSRWLSVIYLDSTVHSLSPGAIVRELADKSIEARPVWRPMHMQPLFESCEVIGGSTSERLFATGLCLPSSSSLTEPQQLRVVNELTRVLSTRTTDNPRIRAS